MYHFDHIGYVLASLRMNSHRHEQVVEKTTKNVNSECIHEEASLRDEPKEKNCQNRGRRSLHVGDLNKKLACRRAPTKDRNVVVGCLKSAIPS